VFPQNTRSDDAGDVSCCRQYFDRAVPSCTTAFACHSIAVARIALNDLLNPPDHDRLVSRHAPLVALR
jgi:hypothetical protein